MKTIISLAGASCVMALLAGCQSSGSAAARLQQKSELARYLGTDELWKLEGGVVEAGYTADMDYVALGRPTAVSVTEDRRVGIWTYRHYLPSGAVSDRPFYAIRGEYRGRPPFRRGGSSAGAHDGGAGPNPIARSSGTGSPAGPSWAMPQVTPVTLHVLFEKGHVARFALNDGG